MFLLINHVDGDKIHNYISREQEFIKTFVFQPSDDAVIILNSKMTCFTNFPMGCMTILISYKRSFRKPLIQFNR